MVKTGIGHALYKTGHLNVDHAAAVVAHVLFKLGQVRELAVGAGELRFAKLLAPIELGVAVFILVPAVLAGFAAQVFKIFNIYLGYHEAVLAFV